MSVTGVTDRPPGLISPASLFYPPVILQGTFGSLIPGDLSSIIVTGTFLNFLGVPASGTVTFTPSITPLKDVASTMFTGGAIVATLNGSGSFSVSLTCTSNNDILPFAWTYTITTNINGVSTVYPGKAIPYSPSSTVDLTALLP